MRKFFKLGVLASVFSDHVSSLKVTKNVPGSTEKKLSKLVNEANGNGHIVEIDQAEYNEMLSKLTPGEREAAILEQGYKPNEVSDESETDNGEIAPNRVKAEVDEVREGLLNRLAKIKGIPNSKREEAATMSNEELTKFIDKNK